MWSVTEPTTVRLAVLIDADNVSASHAAGLLAELARYGAPTVKRAYGDWTTQQLAGWKAELARHALAARDLPLALDASLRAAEEAARCSAPAEALVHYEEALQLWGVVEDGRRPEGRDPATIAIAAAAVAGRGKAKSLLRP